MLKITKEQAIIHGRSGVEGSYYQLPDINNGTTIAHAIFTGEHGQRTIGDHARIYYILSGTAKFKINEDEFEAKSGDVVAIPTYGTYNLWPISVPVEVLLWMEYLDFDKLPK